MHWRVQILFACVIGASSWDIKWKRKQQENKEYLRSVELGWDGNYVSRSLTDQKTLIRKEAKIKEVGIQRHNPSHDTEHVGVIKLDRRQEVKRSKVGQDGSSLLDMKRREGNDTTCIEAFSSSGCTSHSHQGTCDHVYFPAWDLCGNCIDTGTETLELTMSTFQTLGTSARWCGEMPYLPVGSGWCRPEECAGSTDSECRTNGYFKDGSNLNDCKAQCNQENHCIGFAISSANHETANRCYVYTHAMYGPAPDGWTEHKRNYFSIGNSTGGDEASCFHRVVAETGRCHQNGDTGGFCAKQSGGGGIQACLTSADNMPDVTAIEYYERGDATASTSHTDHCLLFHNSAFAPTFCPTDFTPYPGSGSGTGQTITRYRGDYTYDTVCMVLPHKGQFDLIGTGLCRPDSCETLTDECRVNGVYKNESSFAQCDAACTAIDRCIGFAHADEGHATIPDRCYLYFVEFPSSDAAVTTGTWVLENSSYGDISSSTGDSNAVCYRKAATICGQTCTQVISSGSVTCDTTTWGDRCGSDEPPTGTTSSWTMSQFCPRECGSLDPTSGGMDICGHSCSAVVADQGVSCDDNTWEDGCADDILPPYGFQKASKVSELCPRECGKAVWAQDHCQFDNWGPWNACPVTCGISDQSRSRNISRSAVLGGSCGSTHESRACEVSSCPHEKNASESTTTAGFGEDEEGQLGSEVALNKSGGAVAEKEEEEEGIADYLLNNMWIVAVAAVVVIVGAGGFVYWRQQQKKGKEDAGEGEEDWGGEGW